jgi:hypothetical protein
MISARPDANVKLDMSVIVRVIACYQHRVQLHGVVIMPAGPLVAVLLVNQHALYQINKLV